jgi:protein-tyrosine phosphatase
MSTYRINGPWRGNLAIVSRPRGDDWLRDEVRTWNNGGLDVIVSLLTKEEEAEFGLSAEKTICEEQGLQFFSLPIADLGVPSSRADTLELLSRIEQLLGGGKSVGIHCRQGIGRSGIMAIGLLLMFGVDAAKAFEIVSRARGLPVPETQEQRDWILEFANEVAPTVTQS